MQTGPAPDQRERKIAPSHADLLDSARAVRDAVVSDDRPLLLSNLRYLRRQMVEHLVSERETIAGLSGALPQVVQSGQRRINTMLDGLLDTLKRDGSRYTRTVVELEGLMRRQTRLEEAIFHRHRPAPGGHEAHERDALDETPT